MNLKTGDVLRERYRIGRVLGRGGMGVVYRAWDGRLEVPVAIKEMSPQAVLSAEKFDQLREQFVQEARTLARLNHPHLVRVTDYFSEGGSEYLVMDFAEGENLVEWIHRQGPLPEEQILIWAGQLLDALAYCHDNGVYHRDVKPQNVIVSPDGRAVLVDFGLVKQVDAADQRTMTVIRGMGTPEYAPPEQSGYGYAHTDARSDIYSVGAMLYHLLTGQVPPTVTQRTADPELLKPIRELDPRVSPRTEAAVNKALQLARKDRWANAREMAAALGVTGPVTLSATPTQSPPPSQPGSTTIMAAPPRRNLAWLGWLVGGVTIVAIVLLTVWLRSRGGDTATPTPERIVVRTTSTLTPTWTTVSTRPRSTATDTVTPRPASTNTSTATATARATPTNTPRSLVVPTRTHTLTPRPATATPVPTSTTAPTPTATSVSPTPTSAERWLPAPRLTGPEEGASFTGWNAEVILEWAPVDGVQADEYYVVSVPYDVAGGTATFWRQETWFRVPSNFSGKNVGFADRHYNWWVQVKRCTQNCDQVLNDAVHKEGIAVGTASRQGLFYWYSDVGGVEPTPTVTRN